MTQDAFIPQESHPPASGDESGSHGPAHHVRTLLVIYAILMGLLVVTVMAAFVQLGVLNIYVAMGIALTKAVLVVLFFMHVLHAGRLIWAASVAAFLWLAILIAMTMGDYASRGRITRGDAIPFASPQATD
jgi:cytochrome c oxidase subunit 4